EAARLRLTNGRIRGDRKAHDYKTTKAAHEHAMGLTLAGGRDLEIDHLHISGLPGSGVSTRVTVGRGAGPSVYVKASYLTPTPAELAPPGEPSLMTTHLIPISNLGDSFEFGYTLGYQGFPAIRARQFQVHFHDREGALLSKRDALQFER